MTIVSWLQLLLLEEEILCYIIPSVSFSFIGWTCFNPCMYIQSSKTGSCDFLHYMYVMVFERKQWGWLYHWFKLDMKYRYQLIHGIILQPFRTPYLYKACSLNECANPSLEESRILLESPFNVKLNGLCPNYV